MICGLRGLGSIACFSEFFLEGYFFSMFAHLDEIWGGFGRPKWELRSNFDRFSAAFFSSTFGNRFFGDFFFRIQTLIFVRTASVLEHFHKIDGFLKSSKKTWILAPFSEAETEKNQEKNVLRNMRFSDIDFLASFCDF